MTTCGIIAEYNPFHNGHLLQLNKSAAITKAENIAVVMSGNFVQRGEPALCDKYLRTKMALLNGADIVFELPVYFATASAEFFAGASVAILNESGIVDCLCFGSESGEIDGLSRIAHILAHEPEEFKTGLKKELKKGLSFPAARLNVLQSIGIANVEYLNEPNNILAVEYLKSLKFINSKIQPFTIKRETAHYHSKQLYPEISSATAIRNFILGNPLSLDALKDSMPEASFNILQNEVLSVDSLNYMDRFTQIFQYILRTTSKQYLEDILDMNEGIENRIFAVSGKYNCISDILANVKTKRYTFTKLQRAVLHTILDIRTADFKNFMKNGGPQYIRVLGFRKEKSHLLAKMEKNSGLPVVLNLKNAKKTLGSHAMKMLEHEIMTTDIYYSAMNNPKKIKYEYDEPICII